MQGPLAHPVRPDSYIEITNFYTATVYNKGAELIRMMRTILGAETFRAGSDLYFERHDGEAATCEDFVKALEDASGVDLSQFRLWYSQAGTPQVDARLEHDAGGATRDAAPRRSAIARHAGPAGQGSRCRSRCKTALIGADSGAEIARRAADPARPSRAQAIRFDDVDEPPLLSINRGFSAPVDRRGRAPRRRARAAGAERYRPVRPLRGDAGADAATR